MKSRQILILSIIVSLALGFTGGFLFKDFGSGNSVATIKQLINLDNGKPENVDFSLFWKVYNDLSAKYVDKGKVDPQKILYGAIDGLVNSIGDPYTVFFEPVTSKKFQEEISGSFGGVGIEMGKRNNILTVIAPIKDTPAFKAGIKAGDKILKIDGKSTADLSIEEAVTMIRGKRGTKVILTIQNSTTKDVELIRDAIKIPTIDWELIEQGGKKIAYIQIYSFNQTVDSEFKKASEEILKSNADRLIIDLRNNPGGLLDSAINLVGWFLDKNQVVVSEVFRDGTKNEFRSDGNVLLKKYPTVILMNSGSASASEILAGALHDNRGIKIVFGSRASKLWRRFITQSNYRKMAHAGGNFNLGQRHRSRC
ncbi:MAG: Carboxyl-terminal protease [Candidatus Yanofskybacteria bacterium GW2011_GWA1_41_6]|uniref:Carboxyl-terminal protease n=1 Tax=Candidatus Yanofskybacteria bacterium GW2011_GWA1_41_6 TaxID=1619020 RepID=A0A0G0WJ89_9BACT|nr:MAG: Carboxyl-terminal protease [Candidatus Yanofskybacteria bacterium GW2011_GWA1_41_6]